MAQPVLRSPILIDTDIDADIDDVVLAKDAELMVDDLLLFAPSARVGENPQ